MSHYLLLFLVNPLLDKVNKVNKARKLYLIKNKEIIFFTINFRFKYLVLGKKKVISMMMDPD